jgi:hypothetical protein
VPDTTINAEEPRTMPVVCMRCHSVYKHIPACPSYVPGGPASSGYCPECTIIMEAQWYGPGGDLDQLRVARAKEVSRA